MAPEEPTNVTVLPFRHDSDEAITRDPFGGWMALLGQFDVFGSDQGDSPVWIPLRYDAISKVMRDTETFSRRFTDAYSTPVGAPLIPIHLDPPEHSKYRRLLNPLLSPQVTKDLIPEIRARAVQLVDECAARGQVEYMQDFAFRYAPVIFFGLMGMPLDGVDEITALVDHALHPDTANDPEGKQRQAAFGQILDLLSDVIAARRAEPQDDFVSSLVTAEIDGRPLTDDELRQMCLLLLLAGLDTVAATLGYAMLHLAQHPKDRDDLVAHPELMESAVEEILRFYPIDTSVRFVTSDTTFAGCPMQAGDRVVLPFITANRDPDTFEDADTFDIRRAPNRHIGFGVGPHRCVGSHLARLELVIALEEWHRKIPSYELAADAQPVNLVSTTVYRLDHLPLVWGA